MLNKCLAVLSALLFLLATACDKPKPYQPEPNRTQTSGTQSNPGDGSGGWNSSDCSELDLRSLEIELHSDAGNFLDPIYGPRILAQGDFSGRAIAIKLPLPNGKNRLFCDTQELESYGGELSAFASILQSDPVDAFSMSSFVIGGGEGGEASASVAVGSATVSLSGNTVEVSGLNAFASADCGETIILSSSVDFGSLIVNGSAIAITGNPNQTVPITGGQAIIHYRIDKPDRVSVIGLRIITGGQEVWLGQVRAGIGCDGIISGVE